MFFRTLKFNWLYWPNQFIKWLYVTTQIGILSNILRHLPETWIGSTTETTTVCLNIRSIPESPQPPAPPPLLPEWAIACSYVVCILWVRCIWIAHGEDPIDCVIAAPHSHYQIGCFQSGVGGGGGFRLVGGRGWWWIVQIGPSVWDNLVALQQSEEIPVSLGVGSPKSDNHGLCTYCHALHVLDKYVVVWPQDAVLAGHLLLGTFPLRFPSTWLPIGNVILCVNK